MLIILILVASIALVLFALLFGVTWAQLKLLGKRVEYA